MGRYIVKLTEAQRKELQDLAGSGTRPVRELKRAWVLLKADAGRQGTEIAEALEITPATVCGTKRRFVEEGLEAALHDRPRPGRPPKLDERGEAHLIAVACSTPPEGHDHWTLRLLASKVVELGLADSFSHEEVRRRLKKTNSSPGRRRPGAFPR
jgi:transposase